MKLIPITTSRLSPGVPKDPAEWIIFQLQKNNKSPGEKSVLAVSSKIISYLEGRVILLAEVTPTRKAKNLAKKFGRSEQLFQLILNESDEVVYHNHLVSLCRKNGVYSSNAGIDSSNVPEGYVALWPKDPMETAGIVQRSLKKKFGLKKMGVIIIDSICLPGRRGTLAISIGYSGVVPLRNWVNKKDLYEKKIRYSSHNIIDALATSANLIMGEGTERTPIVIIENPPVDFSGNSKGDLIIPKEEDLFPLKSNT